MPEIPDEVLSTIAARANSTILGEGGKVLPEDVIALVAEVRTLRHRLRHNLEICRHVADQLKPAPGPPAEPRQCECHRCIKENNLMWNGIRLDNARMILCPLCGNKRCPRASDHRLGCTGSNDSGQPGSVYR